jgi:hypothetical protein
MFFMRAGPLSDDRIIDLLNHYFVPVSMSNDAHTRGECSKEDLALKGRIVRESWEDLKNIRTGEDAVYVLTPDGRFYDAIRAPDSIRISHLLPFLEGVKDRLKIHRGARPVLEPKRQSRPPHLQPGEIVLHLAARYLPKGDGWAKMPAEDWIVLTTDEWTKLIPKQGAKAGEQWDLDPALTAKLLVRFYPPTGNTDLRLNVMDKDQTGLKATLLATENGVARVRLDGTLKMKHPFFTTGLGPAAQVQQSDDYYVVIDQITGVMECDTQKPALRSLNVVGDKATYATKNFIVALRSHPQD